MLPLQDLEHVRLLRTSLRRFADEHVTREAARDWDARDEFPRAAFDALADLGVMGLTVPEEFGGSGPDIPATMAVIEELAARSLAICTPFIMSACYAGMNIAEVGSAEQKRTLLPRVAAGRMMFAYGISEPDVGSDVADVRTTARREGDTVVLNGAKRFCSGAPFADFIYVVARSGPADQRYRNLSIVLVPPDAPGLIIEQQHALGFKGTRTSDVTFDDVRVPFENVVGGADGWNDGWARIAGRGLDVEKIEVAAIGLGIARAAVDDAWSYAQERVQFGKVISSFQSIRHILAEVKTKLETCRLMVYNAAALIGGGESAGVATSMAKLFVTETAVEIVLACQKIMGAYGYVRDHAMERYVREVLALPIIGGSSAIQKNNIVNRLKLPR